MEEIHRLKAQISNIMVANFPGTEVYLKPRLGPPNDLQVRKYILARSNAQISFSLKS